MLSVKIIIAVTVSVMLLLLHPQNPAAAAERSDYEDFFAAVRSFEDGFYDIARTQFETFVKVHQDSRYLAQARLYLGRTYYSLNKYNQALEELHAVASSAVESHLKESAVYWCGEVHFKARDYQSARLEYQKILEERPSDDRIISKCAGLYERLQNIPEALKMHRRAAEVLEKKLGM